MITINSDSANLEALAMQSAHVPQYISVSSDNIPITGKFRYIWDIVLPQGPIRFKTFPDVDGLGYFDVAKIVRYFFNRKNFPLNISVDVVNRLIVSTDNTIDLKFDIEIGEEIDNVEYPNLYTQSFLYLLDAMPYQQSSAVKINTNTNTALIGQAANELSGYGCNAPRKFYKTDKTISILPFYNPVYGTGTPLQNIDIEITAFNANGTTNVQTIINNKMQLGGYNGVGVGNYIISKLQTLIPSINFVSKSLKVKGLFGSAGIEEELYIEYLCEDVIELYFMNRKGCYEQFVFTYFKESNQVARTSFKNYVKPNKPYQISSTNGPSLVNQQFDKSVVNNIKTFYECAKVCDSYAEYISFTELLQSPQVYAVKPIEEDGGLYAHAFMLCNIRTDSSSGYVPKYDKAMELKVTIEMFNEQNQRL